MRSRTVIYDRLSVVYDWIAEASERRSRLRALKALAATNGETVLEVGVGTGRALPAIARAVGAEGRVLGLDLSANMLHIAKGYIESLGLGRTVALQRGNALALPYPSACVDALFMSFTLELFEAAELPLVLSEAYRVLRPHARLCVVSLAEGEATTRRGRLYQWFRRRWPRLIDCRPIDLSRVLTAAGFRVRSAEESDVSGLPVRLAVACKLPVPRGR